MVSLMKQVQMLAVLAMFGAAVLMVGCGSTPEQLEAKAEAKRLKIAEKQAKKDEKKSAKRAKRMAKQVRGKMTPELYSTADTGGQHLNRRARSIDLTSSQASADAQWLLLLDSPIRLTEYPIP